jgi:ribonuclease Z
MSCIHPMERMATLHLLGTGAALADAHRTTTMLAARAGGSTVVVDCGGDVVQRLLAAGVELDGIEALILTHEHPDHVGGFPLFMEKIWLAERRRPIPVHGPAAAISQARRIFESFDTSGWKGVPEIQRREVALEQGSTVLESGAWRITAAPGSHSVPVIALRLEAAGGGVVAYSADTEPSSAVAELARGADILVHEATGGFKGHTSIEDAAAIASRAGARRLILVHLPPNPPASELERARRTFGETEFGDEGGAYGF